MRAAAAGGWAANALRCSVATIVMAVKSMTAMAVNVEREDATAAAI